MPVFLRDAAIVTIMITEYRKRAPHGKILNVYFLNVSGALKPCAGETLVIYGNSPRVQQSHASIISYVSRVLQNVYLGLLQPLPFLCRKHVTLAHAIVLTNNNNCYCRVLNPTNAPALLTKTLPLLLSAQYLTTMSSLTTRHRLNRNHQQLTASRKH